LAPIRVKLLPGWQINEFFGVENSDYDQSLDANS